MRKLLLLLPLLASCTGPGQDQQAYNRVVGAAIHDPVSATCYYETSGCNSKDMSGNRALSSSYNGRDKIPYPRDGYILGPDGLYWFEPLALSRKGL